jgi:dTDP-4-amino-4,6-dideoxygalactose transaminase
MISVSGESLPAILGGKPVRPQGPPVWPMDDDDVLAALQAAYRDGSWGKYQGGNLQRLEESLQEYHGIEFAVACGSGTFAVELALRALKVGAGDEVVLAAYDYPGNFLCVHAVGATPVLVDVDPDNWNLDPRQVAGAISPATRAVIVSHLHGGAAAMREIIELAGEHRAAVIEDAAQQPGSLVQGRKAGTWGDAAILSFGGSKLLSAGRGGALLTRHADVHQRARLHMHRGNLLCPLSELQGAVLLPQLAKLDARNDHRRANVQRLMERLRDVPGLRPFVNRCDAEPGYYKLGWQYDAAQFGLPRDRFVAAMRAEGVAFDEGFAALHVGRSPNRFRAVSELREAEQAHRGVVVLHHPVLLGGEAEMAEVEEAIRKVQRNSASLAAVL